MRNLATLLTICGWSGACLFGLSACDTVPASCQAYTCPVSQVRNVNVMPSVMIIYWGWPTGYPEPTPGSLLACGADDFPSHNRPALQSLVREVGSTRWLNTLSQYAWDATPQCARRSGMTTGRPALPTICPPVRPSESEPQPFYVQITTPLPNTVLPQGRPGGEALALDVPSFQSRHQDFPAEQGCGPLPEIQRCLAQPSELPMPSTTGRNDLATEKMIVDRVHDCQYGTDGIFGDTIYILALPYGVQGSKTGSDGADGFTCGAHFTTPSGVPFVEQQYFSGVDRCFAFGLEPAETVASSVTSTAFHEIAEAIVNPIVDDEYSDPYHGWGALPGSSGEELGDRPCQDRTKLFRAPMSVAPYYMWLQPLWSNNATDQGGDCVQSYRSDIDFDNFVVSGNDLYHSAAGGAWEDWGTPFAPKPLSRPSAISGAPTYTPNSNENHVFVQDARGDVWERWDRGPEGGWMAWGNASPALNGRPEAVAPRTNRFDVFVVDIFGRLQWNSRADGALDIPAWTAIGFPGGFRGTLKSSPAVVSWSPLREDVFAITYGDELWHTSVSAGDWTREQHDWDQIAWPSPGDFGGPKGDPDATSWGDQRLDLVIFDSRNQLWRYSVDHASPDKGEWSRWPDPPVVSSDPSIVSLGEGRLVVSVLGADCHIYKSTWSRRANFGPWVSQGGCASKGPDLSSKW